MKTIRVSNRSFPIFKWTKIDLPNAVSKEYSNFPAFLSFWEKMEGAGLRPFWTEANLVYVHLTHAKRPELTEVSRFVVLFACVGANDASSIRLLTLGDDTSWSSTAKWVEHMKRMKSSKLYSSGFFKSIAHLYIRAH